jgi:predicted ATPase
MPQVPFLTRVVLKDFKSIASCDVRLGPLTFLVGPNGAGKSNFLDALRFVSHAVYFSLDGVLRERGGVAEVCRRGSRSGELGMRLEFNLSSPNPDQGPTGGSYAFLIDQKSLGGWQVRKEECIIHDARSPTGNYGYRVEGGQVVEAYTSRTESRDTPPAEQVLPPVSGDRFYLSNAAGLPEFWPVWDSLTDVAVYHLNPHRIRDIQAANSGETLTEDGGNLASAFSRLEEYPEDRARVIEYLSRVDPSVQDVAVRAFENYLALEFMQHSSNPNAPNRFSALHMSDGTLHALGVLVALFHTSARGVPLVGIEEPETALHPAASGALLDAMREASHRVQVIATSHSADLLDDKELGADSILAVIADDGQTHIGPIDEVGRSALRDRLYTVGELLRLNQLSPGNGVPREVVAADLFSGH